MIAMIGGTIHAPMHPIASGAPSSHGYGNLKASILRECEQARTARQIADRLQRPLSVVKATLALLLRTNAVTASREGRRREFIYRSAA